jgi:LPXTG-motif cell wall-anchored protein
VVFAEAQNEYPDSIFNSVSCGSVGNCTAVGRFKNVGGGYEAFTMTSTDGVWGQGTPALFADGVQLDSPNSEFRSVSCASAGNCTAVGRFRNVGDRDEAFTMTSTNGVWGQATPALFADGVQHDKPDAEFRSVSCASAGNCTAVGFFWNVDRYLAFTMTSTDGVWGQGIPALFADGVRNESSEEQFNSVSCGSVGNCYAVGFFVDVNWNYVAFTMTSTDGVWGQATPVVFAEAQNEYPNSSSYSVSCGSVGNCTAVGVFKNVGGGYEAFTMMSTYTPPAETTTTVAATTTTVAATTTTVAAALLPATGSDSNGWLVAAMCAVITGTVLITRRRRIN